jgi:hypothetical protein
MRVTIIKDDNAVNVDGERHTVDCSGLPADFHALQWDGTIGEIEYRMVACSHCGGRNKKPNALISDLAPYSVYVDGWHVAKAAAEKAYAEAKAEAEAKAAEANAQGEARFKAEVAAAVAAELQKVNNAAG